MPEITNAEASANILAACNAGTLVQGKWHGHAEDGREIACLLGSIHPGVRSPADCNGALMPMWLAELTPVLFDGLPQSEIEPIARRYGEMVARWHVLLPDDWDAVLCDFLGGVIDAALSMGGYLPSVAVADAAGTARAAWAALAAAEAVRVAEAAANAAAAGRAGRAAWTAATSTTRATRAARAATIAAACAATRAAWAAGASRAAGEAAAYHGMFVAMLDHIEARL